MPSYLYQQRILLEDNTEYILDVILPSKPLRLYNTTSCMIGRAETAALLSESTLPPEVKRLDIKTNELVFDYELSHASFNFDEAKSKLRR